MKPRKLPLGYSNVIGAQVTQIRLRKRIKQKDMVAQLQTEGIDINPSNASKLEGQQRQVTDIELVAISRVLGVPILELFPEKIRSRQVDKK